MPAASPLASSTYSAPASAPSMIASDPQCLEGVHLETYKSRGLSQVKRNRIRIRIRLEANQADSSVFSSSGLSLRPSDNSTMMSPDEQLRKLQRYTEEIMASMAGGLRNFTLEAFSGRICRGEDAGRRWTDGSIDG